MSATAYITVSTLTTAYGNAVIARLLSNRSGNKADGADLTANAELLAAIESANARVDSYVKPRYTPSDVSTDASLQDDAMAIAIYTLAKRTRNEISEAHREQYNDAIRHLELVAKGYVQAGVELTYPPGHRAEALLAPAVVDLGSDIDTDDATKASGQDWWDNW